MTKLGAYQEEDSFHLARDRIIKMYRETNDDRLLEVLSSLYLFREEMETDKLTGLRNKGYLGRAGKTIKERSYKGKDLVTAVYFDVNGFKAVNDNFGHDVGDRVLEMISKPLREYDAIRLGGDEFVIILPGCSNGDAAKVAKRIKNHIERAKSHYLGMFGSKLTGEQRSVVEGLGMAAGVETREMDINSPNLQGDILDLVKSADRGMYKDKGKKAR